MFNVLQICFFGAISLLLIYYFVLLKFYTIMETLQKKLSDAQMQSLKEKIAQVEYDRVRNTLLEHWGIDIDLPDADEALRTKLTMTLERDIFPEVIEAIARGALMGKISENNLNLSLNKENLPLKLAEPILLAVKAGQFSEVTMDLLIQRPYWLRYKDFEPLLVDLLIDGKMSEKSFLSLPTCYRFKKSSWKKMFESGVDFLVKAYLEKFYPEIVLEA